MSAFAGGILAEAGRRAAGLLIEPLGPDPPARPRAPADALCVAVVGLTPGCGTTTVARAIGLGLAARSPRGAAVVATPALPVGAGRAGVGRARRLAGGEELPGRGLGRLAIVGADLIEPLVRGLRGVAPVVLEVGHGAEPWVAAALADVVVLVVAGATRPELVAAVADEFDRAGGGPLLAINRCSGEEPAAPGIGTVAFPVAALAARLVNRGLLPPGAFGASANELAGLCAGA